jgi:homoserine kinase type II
MTGSQAPVVEMLWEARDPHRVLDGRFGFGDARSAGRWVADVLCADGEITAVLDFEEARHGHRLVDLARATVLLGTRYHDWGPVPPEVQARFLAGYQSVRPLTPAESGWWDILLLWQALAMVPPGEDPTGWGPSALSRLPHP